MLKSLKSGIYSETKHQKVLIKHLKSQIYKLLKEKGLYRDSWKHPDDFIQVIMEEKGFDPKNINYEEIADKLCFYIFGSVHILYTCY